jgi:hypothetical protein
VHKTANILNALPNRLQGKAKAEPHGVRVKCCGLID